MIHAGQTVVANPNGKKGFLIPVSWMVSDFVRVQADTLDEAIDWMLKHHDEVPLGTEPEYIDASYEVNSEVAEIYLDEAVNYSSENHIT